MNAAPARLTATVLGCPDPSALARFYRSILGWEIGADEPGWATLRPADRSAGLSFQQEDDHVRPAWPAEAGEQQMQLHLDLQVDDLDAAGEIAAAAGATLSPFQPQDDVRVWLDPAGHPFCFWVDTST